VVSTTAPLFDGDASSFRNTCKLRLRKAVQLLVGELRGKWGRLAAPPAFEAPPRSLGKIHVCMEASINYSQKWSPNRWGIAAIAFCIIFPSWPLMVFIHCRCHQMRSPFFGGDTPSFVAIFPMLLLTCLAAVVCCLALRSCELGPNRPTVGTICEARVSSLLLLVRHSQSPIKRSVKVLQ